VVGDRAEVTDLSAQSGRGDAELPFRGEETDDVRQVVVSGAEVLEGIDAHDDIELTRRKRQVVRVRPDGVDTTPHALRLEHGGRDMRRNPQIGCPHLDTELSGQEDRRRSSAGSKIEYSHARSQIEVARQILEQPERVGTHVQADQPPWVVIARSRVFGSLQVI